MKIISWPPRTDICIALGCYKRKKNICLKRSDHKQIGRNTRNGTVKYFSQNMEDLKLSQLKNMLKSYWAISHLSAELKTNISEISTFRVDVVNYHKLLIYMPICGIADSSSWHTMQQEVGVKLCSHPSDANLSPCHWDWCPCCQLLCHLFIIFPAFACLGYSWPMHAKMP